MLENNFKTVKTETRKLADSLDHPFLNEIEPFDRINPTAENLACWFYHNHSAYALIKRDKAKLILEAQ
jgi:6-pyruvoyltetrahydropterin/6-carboxytetrahydropterin synthase